MIAKLTHGSRRTVVWSSPIGMNTRGVPLSIQ
jgi:hypothetical protein